MSGDGNIPVAGVDFGVVPGCGYPAYTEIDVARLSPHVYRESCGLPSCAGGATCARAKLMNSTYILSLKRPARTARTPVSITDAINGLPGVQILGGDPFAGLEVIIPDSMTNEVRRRVASFAHVEMYEDLHLL